ncbi:hypothetical protein G9A89_004943 [Geosiphon pyriformis]|nr:hypothetical protein G9A89_004943 [Geosiphon pyriformis]
MWLQRHAKKAKVEIFYDPVKHKTQAETRKLTKKEIRDYIQSYWVSKDFDSDDLKLTNISQDLHSSKNF